MPDLESLPVFSSLLDHPKFPVAVQRMVDRLNAKDYRVDSVDITAGLLHFFAVIEGDR